MTKKERNEVYRNMLNNFPAMEIGRHGLCWLLMMCTGGLYSRTFCNIEEYAELCKHRTEANLCKGSNLDFWFNRNVYGYAKRKEILIAAIAETDD